MTGPPEGVGPGASGAGAGETPAADAPPPIAGAILREEIRWGRILGGWVLAYAAGGTLGLLFIALGWWQDGAGWERAMVIWAHGTQSPWLDPLFLWIPFVGTNYTLVPIVAVVAGWLWYRGERVVPIHLVVIQLGSWALNPALKFSLMRPRPDLFEHRGQYSFPAYPSGHSIAVTSVLFTAAWILHRTGRGTWGWWVVGVFFVINSWSRVYNSVHWPTDVVGGTVMGLVWLGTGVAVFGPLYELRDARRRDAGESSRSAMEAPPPVA